MGNGPETERQFRDFVRGRYGALLRSAYLLTGNWASAEDLLQTALAKTYLAWDRIEHAGAVEAYTRTVLVRTATSWWRRRWNGERPTARMPELPVVDDTDAYVDRHVLWEHVRVLPPRQRAVLVLRYYEDLSEAETASLLGIGVGTVKSQASRALATLRRAMVEREPQRALAGGEQT